MNRRVDTLVIGGGVAGLFAALRASAHGSVMLATKAALSESNTRYAQGGIAAALFPDDSVKSHVNDTIKAGAGLCDENAVRILCAEGPQRIRDLLTLGVAFDRDGNDLAQGMEAAHAYPRVIHAGGDATGAEVQRGLEAAVRNAGVIIEEHTYLTDLTMSEGGVGGACFMRSTGDVYAVDADVTILATGGAGQTYRFTTNPSVATGDGVAAAFRAGAAIADAEMYQFHPTLLAGPRAFLISEAVRGEGAVLRNARGERFMLDRHPLAELAPRDVVARAIAEEMAECDGEPVYLDATALAESFLAKRFPTIDAHCRKAGFNWATTAVPVTPAAHFWMGGVKTDTWGRTSLPGLYAIGEAACTGVHGANRLASNSLLEGLVFGDRVMRGIVFGSEERVDPSTDMTHKILGPGLRRDDGPSGGNRDDGPSGGNRDDGSSGGRIHVEIADIRQLTWDELGLARNEHGLRVAGKQLALWASGLPNPVTPQEWERLNLITTAQLIATSALLRRESRGAHFRTDFPHRDEKPGSRIVVQRQR